MKTKKILKVRLFLILFMFIASGLVGSFLWSSSTWGTCRINDLSLEKEGNFTKLTIYADKSFEFVHSTIETEDGKPYRIIIDCQDAIYNLPQHDFTMSLPPGTIKAIRTSQFQAEPEKIVRIVLDLDKPAIYKVVERGKDKKGAIAILTAQDLSFPFWAAEKDEEASSEGKLTPSTSVEKITNEGSTTKDNLSTLSENKNWSDSEPAENDKPQEAEKKATFERPLSFADTSEVNTKKETLPVSMAKPESNKSEFESTGKEVESGKKVFEQTGEKVVLATAAASPEVFSAPNQEDKKLQSEQKKDKEAGTIVEKEASKSPTAKGEKEPIQKEPLPSQKEALSSASEAGKVAKEPKEGTETKSLNLTAEKEKLTLVTPEEKSIKEKTAPPESLIVVSQSEGTELEAVFQRKVIYYQGEDRRDPFAPLTERISTDFGKIPLPMFESLKLVGVLKDEEGNRALLEDEKGYGYILKNGDKIKNGYVVSVEDNKVFFQIEEYGWSRTIALELSTEY